MNQDDDKEPLEKDVPPKKESPQLTPINIKKVTLPPISSKMQKESDFDSDFGSEDISHDQSLELSDQLKQKKTLQSIEADDSSIIDPDTFDSDLVDQTMTNIEFDSGMAIDLDHLDEDQIFSDLKDTDETLAILKQHGQKSVYISRVYQPPSILYNLPKREILEKFSSLYLLSIGTGRNLWMAPELVSSYSKTVFNPNIRIKSKGAEITQVNDIKTTEQLENSFQNALDHLKKFNLLILGTMFLESNSFKESPIIECPVGKVTLKRLEQILEDRQNSFEVPKLSDNQFISIRYYGPNSDIITNSEAQGLMDIADEITTKEIFQKGILSGIVCVDKYSAHFFILSNNLKQLHESNPKYTIDQPTLEMMYQMIKSYELTPVCWFRIRFGMDSFDFIELGQNMTGTWYDIKNQGQLKVIFNEYYKYLQKILKSRADQKEIQNHMDEIEKNREELMKKIFKE